MPRTRRSVEEWSAGGVVLRVIEGVPHALVIRDPYKNWGLPKGHVEEGEELEGTALREVREETGLRELELGVELGTIDWWFGHGDKRVHKHCTFFLMLSREGEAVPEAAEGISACEWLPVEEAVRRITYDNAREMVREALSRLDAGRTGLSLEGEAG